MRTFLTVVFLTSLLSCSDSFMDRPIISPEASWTANFEKAKGHLRPVDNYARTFTLKPNCDVSMYRLCCMPIEKRQVYVCNSMREIRVVSDGVVGGVLTLSGKRALIVKHGDYLTVYLNLDEAFFNKGDKIARGTKIGMIAGDSTGTEFRFEIYKKNDKLTPAEWILNAP